MGGSLIHLGDNYGLSLLFPDSPFCDFFRIHLTLIFGMSLMYMKQR